MIMLRIPAAESFCRHNCPHLSNQLSSLESGSPDRLPSKMCPRAAAVIVRGLAKDVAHSSGDNVLGLVLADDTSAEEFIDLVDLSADRFDGKASRCAKTIIHRGTDTMVFDKVATITSEDILDLYGALGASPVIEQA
jgi:hypothetical protein